jgi:hypothetical protein
METITDNCHIFSEGTTITNKTIEIEANGLLHGIGGRTSIIHSIANPIIRVLTNAHNQFVKNAFLENIILEGDNSTTSQIAIELNDVSRCNISNVLIKDVDVGIKIRANMGNSSNFNSIEHVQIENVNKGIQFHNNGSGNFGSTHIDDVSIALNDQENLVGIEVGAGCTLTMPQVFANVTSIENCIGMHIDGAVSGESIQFSHTKDSAEYGGVGVLLGEHASVGDQNGHFYVSGQQLSAAVSNPYSIENYIIANSTRLAFAEAVEDSVNATNDTDILGVNDESYATISGTENDSGWISMTIDPSVVSGQISLYGYNLQELENSTVQVYVSDDGDNWTLTSEVELEPSETPFWISGGYSSDPFGYVKVLATVNSSVYMDSVRVEYPVT